MSTNINEGTLTEIPEEMGLCVKCREHFWTSFDESFVGVSTRCHLASRINCHFRSSSCVFIRAATLTATYPYDRRRGKAPEVLTFSCPFTIVDRKISQLQGNLSIVCGSFFTFARSHVKRPLSSNKRTIDYSDFLSSSLVLFL